LGAHSPIPLEIRRRRQEFCRNSGSIPSPNSSVALVKIARDLDCRSQSPSFSSVKDYSILAKAALMNDTRRSPQAPPLDSPDSHTWDGPSIGAISAVELAV
jgi:hypothetical protein